MAPPWHRSVNDNSANRDHSPKLLGLDPVIAGTACCIVSAFAYTGANICLRQLADLGADEMWVICVKELVTVVTVGSWLLLRKTRGARLRGPRAVLLGLMVTGLAVQLFGNLGVQWAFGVVGMVITIPLIFGTMLTASALLGLAFLKERVPVRSVAAITVLIVSIVFLSCGAGEDTGTRTASAGEPALPVVLLAVGAACLGGCMYAGLSTMIRSSATAQVPVTTVVFIITGMGVLSLGSLSVVRLGVKELAATSWEQLIWMLAAGMFNLIAFLAITKGLQLTTVVRANLLNASQIAMAAMAGILLFGESTNVWMICGIALTIVGVTMIAHPASNDRAEG